jgi:8-oxo-dGTP pyrophosphatase MutT (NUDIX family)
MQSEIIYTRKWFPFPQVKKKHKNLPIRQVTCFVLTKDEKLLLVSKDGESWSVTAGHYEAKKDPRVIDTAVREVYEESGLDISRFVDDIKKLGYYVIEDVEKESNKVVDSYLQIRTFLPLDLDSKDIQLKPKEDDLVKHARFFTIQKSMKLITWLKDSGEWKIIKEISN